MSPSNTPVTIAHMKPTGLVAMPENTVARPTTAATRTNQSGAGRPSAMRCRRTRHACRPSATTNRANTGQSERRPCWPTSTAYAGTASIQATVMTRPITLNRRAAFSLRSSAPPSGDTSTIER